MYQEENNIFDDFNIRTPWVIDIIKTIKKIQKRMKDEDIRNIEHIEIYDK
jgi:hypothetical protein